MRDRGRDRRRGTRDAACRELRADARALTSTQRHSVTPSFQMAISRSSFISLRAGWPEATSTIRRMKSSASASCDRRSSMRPASKSIQCGLFCASGEFELIFSVGAGKPSGVPRPVVNSRMVAPAATSAVDEMPSLPGASSSARPGRVDALAVAQHLGHRRMPALLHGAERLLLERRDAAGDVAGRRVLVHRLVVRAGSSA